MSDDKDDAQKTEEPTQKRIDDAFKKGDVPRSQELKHWAMLLAALIAVSMTGNWTASRFQADLGGIVANSWQIRLDDGGALDVVNGVMWNALTTLSAPITLFLLFALGGSVIQHKPLFTMSKLQPKWEKISPMAGLKRLFSMQSLVEFIKTILKFIIVGGVTVAVIWPERATLPQLVTLPVGDLLIFVSAMAVKMLAAVVAIMTVVAVMDFSFQKMQHTKKLRMTKQEVKDEYKQVEGDPHVKARLRQVRQERARQRVATAVPESDVVITNPTHFAVAVKYDHENMEVPIVKAKGLDHLAKRIRELAEENDIPIVENPPLARALYAAVEVDDEIPPEHYKAVASVISYILKLKK